MPHIPHGRLHHNSPFVFIVTFITFLCRGLGLQLLGANQQQSCSVLPFEEDQKLHGLQVVKSNRQLTPLNFSNFDHGSFYTGLYVNEDAHFAFCLMEKNGCSEWSAELAKLQYNDTTINTAHYGICNKFWDERAAEKVFRDPQAVRAVFVRDPLERFLSAYLNKCFQRNCTSNYCLMRNTTKLGVPVLFHRAVDWLSEVNMSKQDAHFKLQSQHCELYRRVHEYTHIGLYEHDTFAHDSRCLLKKAGLKRLDTRGTESNERFWNVGAPEGASNAHEQFSPTNEYLKRFYTPEAAKQAYEIFKADYEIFNIPKPNWMEDATGEFYDSVPKGSCKQSDSQLSSDSGHTKRDMDQISDIPTLARLAGYSLD